MHSTTFSFTNFELFIHNVPLAIYYKLFTFKSGKKFTSLEPISSYKYPPWAGIQSLSSLFGPMGPSTDGDSSQRPRRTSATTNINSAAKENETKTPSYHCNNCNKDITGKIQIKCAQCPDFDLCVESFSVGVEVAPHKSEHPCRVMHSLSSPFLSPDWSANEEVLILEGMARYGMENWAQVAEHVGTKCYAECILHYRSVYLERPNFPSPDMNGILGNNQTEILAMAKEEDKSKKDMKSLDMALMEGALDATQVQGNQATSSVGEESLSGYNPKGGEFEPEYDNEAEKLIADMEFQDSDTEDERELKLRVLYAYSRRLDERERRKKFILERNLLEADPFVKDLSPEERKIYNQYNVFQRFHSKEEHETLIKTVIEEHRVEKLIEELMEAQRFGCRTLAQVGKYFEIKRRLEAEECDRRARESSRVPTKGPATTSSLNVQDIMGLPGSDLLSDYEKQLCCDMKMFPSEYLKIQGKMIALILKGQINKKLDAHSFFSIDCNKIDRVYDVLDTKGIAHR